MKNCLIILFAVLFYQFSIYAQNRQIVKIDLNESLPQQISLDGKWEFVPANGELKPENSNPLLVDKKAKEIDQILNEVDGFEIMVPQLLNKMSWWLTGVSKEFEKQEEDRINAFPLDAANLQSGWYVKTIDLTSVPKNAKIQKEVIADFEGVATVSRVYFNGNYVGGHLGMFGSFQCRLTPYLKAGEKNSLLVYVERGIKSDKGDEVVSVAVTVPVTRDMLTSLNSGMFGGFGNGPRAKFMGIWQPVKLLISEPGGRIEDVFFKPSLQGHKIEVTLENPLRTKLTGKLQYSLKDTKTGNILLSENVSEQVSVKSGSETITLEKAGLNPKLWTPDHPNLYHLEVSWLSTDGKLLDKWSMPVGYRTVETRGQEVYLNGKPYWARGAGMPPYGYKPNDEATARGFLQLMHDGNTMVTRSGCNPWNTLWFSLADEIGIGVSHEGVRPWALMSKAPPPPRPIIEHWKAEQLETVRKYRNHPSVLYYEVSNEGLQGDADNKEKQAIFKDIIDAMRKLDPTRPIIQTSGDRDLAGNADIQDIHSYWGWYETSSFINDYTTPMRGLTVVGDKRPFLNEEAAVPYSMIDDGSVHPAYVGRYSAQPWVGDIGTYATGKDVAYFQGHILQEAKLKAEKLRYSRREIPTAGVMLFANVTWIQHALSKPVDQWRPFPVYYGVKEAYQPVLAALQSTQRNFYANDKVNTKVFVVNDNADFKDLKQISLKIEILTGDKAQNVYETKLGDVDYYEVKDYPVTFSIPKVEGTGLKSASIRLSLYSLGKPISVNSYKINIAPNLWINNTDKKLLVSAMGLNKDIEKCIGEDQNLTIKPLNESTGNADVIILGPDAKNVSENEVQSALKRGGRVIVLEQGAASHRFSKEVINESGDVKHDKPVLKDYMFEAGNSASGGLDIVKGEFVEMIGWDKQTDVFKDLGAMDWKWWARGNNQPAYTASAAHNIDIKNPKVTVIGRYLEPHFYWSGNLKKVYESRLRYPVFAVQKEWGQVIICDLVISDAIKYDPRAAKTLLNLIKQPLK